MVEEEVCVRGGEGLASLPQLLWLYRLDSAYCKCVFCRSGAAEALQCGRSRDRTFCTTGCVFRQVWISVAIRRASLSTLRLIVSVAAMLRGCVSD